MFWFVNDPCAMLTGVCEEVYCPGISMVADGPVAGADCMVDAAINRPNCTFNCAPGYRMDGTDTIQCALDGTWPAAPTCTEIQCPAINVAASQTQAGAVCAGGGAASGKLRVQL